MPHHAVVLTSPPGAAAIDTARVERLSEELGGASVTWLAVHEACWIDVPEMPDNAAEIVAAAVEGQPTDANVLPVSRACARKRLLVADMESTIIEQECLDELADYANLRERVAGITERAMRGELDFETALRERVALLKGLDANLLSEVYDERVTLMPGAAALVSTMQANGAMCALVSGGFSVFTERVAARLGFDAHQANVLGVSERKIDGTVAEPILGRDAKLVALRRLAAERQLDIGETLAVGDGANDLAMLGAAGLGVAFRAKPIVAGQARTRVVHGDLTALLYLQGYARDEFIL